MTTFAELGGTYTPTLSLADLENFDRTAPTREGQKERRFLCPLPDCSEKRATAAHRSLAVNVGTGAWNCHRCHAKGKLREFWTEAAKDARPTSRRDRDRQRIRRALQLPPPVQPVDNVDIGEMKKRIGPQLHLSDTPGAFYLESRCLPAEFCHAAGVRFAPEFGRSDKWAGRPAITFPVRDKAARLVAVQGRFIESAGKGDVRILTFGPRGRGVFTTVGALAAPVIVVTEAPIDALSLALCGVPAVALCGCEGRPDWLKVHCAFQAVIAAFDADEAGDKAARTLAADLAGVGARVLRLRPVGAKDWNAALLSRGGDDLRTWLAQELASVALTGTAATETSESPTEPVASLSGQNWAVSEAFGDPLAGLDIPEWYAPECPPWPGTSRLPPPEYPHLLPSYGGHADARTLEFGRLLLAEARAGTLPPRTDTASEARLSTDTGTVTDPNAAVLALFARCLAAREAGDENDAEAAANAFFDLAEWWHGRVYRPRWAEAAARFAPGIRAVASDIRSITAVGVGRQT